MARRYTHGQKLVRNEFIEAARQRNHRPGVLDISYISEGIDAWQRWRTGQTGVMEGQFADYLSQAQDVAAVMRADSTVLPQLPDPVAAVGQGAGTATLTDLSDLTSEQFQMETLRMYGLATGG